MKDEELIELPAEILSELVSRVVLEVVKLDRAQIQQALRMVGAVTQAAGDKEREATAREILLASGLTLEQCNSELAALRQFCRSFADLIDTKPLPHMVTVSLRDAIVNDIMAAQVRKGPVN